MRIFGNRWPWRGPFEDLRRIVRALALGDEEAVELPYRRQFARRRGRFEAGRLQCREIGAQIVGRGIERAAPARLEAGGIGDEIALVGFQRIHRRAALGRDHLEEKLDQPEGRRVSGLIRHGGSLAA